MPKHKTCCCSLKTLIAQEAVIPVQKTVKPKSLLRKVDFCQKRALLTVWVGNAFLLLIEDLYKVIEDFHKVMEDLRMVIEDLRKVIENLRKVMKDLHKVIEDFWKVMEDFHKVMKDPSVFFTV